MLNVRTYSTRVLGYKEGLKWCKICTTRSIKATVFKVSKKYESILGSIKIR